MSINCFKKDRKGYADDNIISEVPRKMDDVLPGSAKNISAADKRKRHY